MSYDFNPQLPPAGQNIDDLKRWMVDEFRRVSNNLLFEQVWVDAPASATSQGIQGQLAFDASYIYICTATDTWKRAAIATW